MRVGRRMTKVVAVMATLSIAVGTAAPATAIVDGTEIPAGELGPGGRWSFLTQIESSAGTCTGSLIAPTWVLTAAHCAEPPIFLRVGDSTDVITVDRVVVHPQYDAARGQFDLALFELPSASTANPVNLPAVGAELVASGTSIEIAGFGASIRQNGSGVGTPRSGFAVAESSSTSLLTLTSGPSSTAGGDSGGAAMQGTTLIGVHSAVLVDGSNVFMLEMPVVSSLDWISQTISGGGGGGNQPPVVSSGDLFEDASGQVDVPFDFTDPDTPMSFANVVGGDFAGFTDLVGCTAADIPTTCTFVVDPARTEPFRISYRVSDGVTAVDSVWVVHPLTDLPDTPPTGELSIEPSTTPVTGEQVTARVVITDPIAAAAVTCTFDWGRDVVITVPAVDGTCASTRRADVAGRQTVTVTVTVTDTGLSAVLASDLVVTARSARLEGEVTWEQGGRHRLEIEAAPRSGEVELRLPDGRRLEGRVTTMMVEGTSAVVVGTGRLGRRDVSFEVAVIDGGRTRTATDRVSVRVVDRAGDVVFEVADRTVRGLTLR